MSSTALVASNLNHVALISWQGLQKLHVIPKTFPAVAAAACVYNDIKTKTIAAFSCFFSDTLDNKPMCTQRMKNYLKDHSIPYRVSAPLPFPLHFQEPANHEIAHHIKSFPATSQPNGVHQNFLFRRGKASKSDS